MINEVDEALRTLVKADVVNGTDVEVVFDAPTRDWASRRNKPTVDLYLYDIREDTRRRGVGMIERRNERGVVEEREALPRYFKLAYLITAWTQRPEDEHRLLAALMGTFIRYDVVPACERDHPGMSRQPLTPPPADNIPAARASILVCTILWHFRQCRLTRMHGSRRWWLPRGRGCGRL